MTNISIRAAGDADYPAITELLVTVFKESYGTGPEEAQIVEQMRRRSDPDPCISLVATVENTLIGYLFISPVTLRDFPEIPVCTLGPIGITRTWQRQGVGTRLMREGLAACRECGYQAVFLTGSAEYYARFGFVPISETSLVTIFNTSHDMVLELEPGLLARVSGLVEYPEPWLQFVEQDNESLTEGEISSIINTLF
jgi:putative acetyltransferase